MTVAAPYLLLTKGKVYFEVENVGGQDFLAGFAGANWARGPAGGDHMRCVGFDREGATWSVIGDGYLYHG